MGKNRHTLEITKLQQKIKTLPIIARAFLFFFRGEFLPLDNKNRSSGSHKFYEKMWPTSPDSQELFSEIAIFRQTVGWSRAPKNIAGTLLLSSHSCSQIRPLAKFG
jgi:hypothetical protein